MNRRTFLKAIVAGAAAVTVAPTLKYFRPNPIQPRDFTPLEPIDMQGTVELSREAVYQARRGAFAEAIGAEMEAMAKDTREYMDIAMIGGEPPWWRPIRRLRWRRFVGRKWNERRAA